MLVDHLKTYSKIPEVRIEVVEELFEVCLGLIEKVKVYRPKP